MRVDRRFLYWGVFLVAFGGVLVAADLGGIDQTAIEAALVLWPLAVVALGLGIVLRRTRYGAAGWVLAAAVPGLALGGTLAVAPRLAVDCNGGQPASFVTRTGTFEGPASVDVRIGCGSVSVTTAPGSGWRLDTGDVANGTADVTSSSTGLSVVTGRRSFGAGHGGDVWRLTLPTSRIDRLALEVDAGQGDVNLDGAQVGSLVLTTNAGHSVVDASNATVGSISATLDAGALSIRLPGADITGSVEANAGVLAICAPSGVGIRVQQHGVLSATKFQGLAQNGPVWQSPDYDLATHHADLSVNVNLGSVEFDPNGGCR